MAGSVSQLHRLARRYGVQTAYYDVNQRRQRASVEGLMAMLSLLGVPVESLADVPDRLHDAERQRWLQGIEPVIVAWEGQPNSFVLRLPRQCEGPVTCRIECESGENICEAYDLQGIVPCGDARIDGVEYLARRVPLPENIPLGYQQLRVESCETQFTALLISAPRRAYYPEAVSGQRDWGAFIPLYSLHSRRSWGAGNYSDLRELAEWIGSLGGTVVGTLPLMPAFLEHRPDPSPYSPISRLFWNEFYLDVERIPELQSTPAARTLLQSHDVQQEIAQLRATEAIDYSRQMRLIRKVLEPIVAQFWQERPPRFEEFTRFLERQPLVRDYARFRAAFERYQVAWQEWPDAARQGVLTAQDYDESAERFYLFAQWMATEQLQDLTTRSSQAGTGLYLDLPLGVRPDGFDVWKYRNIFLEASAGAPPDAMFTRGQNWGFSPLHPHRLREQHYEYVIRFLRTQLAHCRLMRIDHVMGLHRLYCIPPGQDARHGVYVQYHAEEFYAILNLESHRHKVGLVGENLGTVPTHVNQALRRNNIRGMHVLEYFLNPHATPVLGPAGRGELASLNTHDMPMFAAYWEAADIDDRLDLGLLTPEEAEQQRAERRTIRENITRFLQDEGWLGPEERDPAALTRACLAYLAAGPSATLVVTLEDLWQETRPQNLPGTSWERPNWRRKARLSLEEIRSRPDVQDLLKQIDQLRRQRPKPARRMERRPS